MKLRVTLALLHPSLRGASSSRPLSRIVWGVVPRAVNVICRRALQFCWMASRIRYFQFFMDFRILLFERDVGCYWGWFSVSHVLCWEGWVVESARGFIYGFWIIYFIKNWSVPKRFWQLVRKLFFPSRVLRLFLKTVLVL